MVRHVWAAKEKSFSPETRARMVAFVNDQIAHSRVLERWELALVFSEAAAFSGNNHTQPDFFGEDGLFHSLPFSFWLFSDGAYVTRAHPDYRRLLGARIVRIGNASIDEAARRVGKYIAGTPQRQKYMAPAFLTRLEVLRAVGLASPGESDVEIEFELPSGKHVSERLGPAPSRDPAAVSEAWRASMVPGKGPNPWPHVLDALPTLPLYAQPPDEFTSTPLYGGSLLYIRSNTLSPYEGEIAVQNKAYDIVDTVMKSGKRPEDVVVDLRFWSEGGRVTAPESKLKLHDTDGYHDWATGCDDLSKCYWPVVFHGVAVGSLHPEIPIDLSFADYRSGRDPALDAAIGDIKRRRADVLGGQPGR